MGEQTCLLDIMEAGRGFAVPEIHTVNLETIREYHDDLRAHTYIKAFRSLNGREPIEDEVRWYLESWARSKTQCRVDNEKKMVWRGHWDLELLIDVNQYP